MGRRREKPGGLCHKTPPNMAPQNCVTKIFEKKKKKSKTDEIEFGEGVMELPIPG